MSDDNICDCSLLEPQKFIQIVAKTVGFHLGTGSALPTKWFPGRLPVHCKCCKSKGIIVKIERDNR